MYRRVEDAIQRTIDEMEPVMRSVIIGYFYNQLSIKEIAGASNLAQKEVCALIGNGREKLRNAVLMNNGEERLYMNNRYLYIEIFLSCGEEAVQIGAELAK